MAFGLDPGKLGFKLGDVLVGLKSGTTDVPETIVSDQGRLHVLGYVWDPSGLAYVLPTVDAGGGLLVHVTNTNDEAQLTVRLDDVGGGVVYVGHAAISAAEASSVWRIKTILTVVGLTSILWPSDSTFTHRWDQRAALSYA